MKSRRRRKPTQVTDIHELKYRNVGPSWNAPMSDSHGRPKNYHTGVAYKTDAWFWDTGIRDVRAPFSMPP